MWQWFDRVLGRRRTARLSPFPRCESRGPWVVLFAPRETAYEPLDIADRDAYFWYTLGEASGVPERASGRRSARAGRRFTGSRSAVP